MATTTLGEELTEQQRVRQLGVRALLVKQVLAIWPLFDIRRIDESWKAIEPLLMAGVEQARQVSSVVAFEYYQAFRLSEGVPPEALERPRLDEDWKASATTALRVTGPVAAKIAVANKTPDPKSQALIQLTGASSRIALNGGRDTLSTLVETDKRALGYARVSRRKPCAFCAMLVSRGAVYSKARGSFRAHDHCACSLEPVFKRNQPLPPNAAQYRKIWNEVTKETSGAESIAAFRKALDSAI